jgi:hypothetical protein
MDEQGFRKYLKRAGKKDHVVEGLVNQVKGFEAYLADSRSKSLEEAGEQDIREYAGSLDEEKARVHIRGVALYYSFTGEEALAKLAHEMREQEIAKTRRVFKLSEFRGVSPEAVEKLGRQGIINVDDMLREGKTPKMRQKLSRQTGIPEQAILELVKLADLSRLSGLKSVRARLYYDAGVETPAKMAQWEPEALRQMLVEFVERSGFEGIAPLPKEIRNGIETARKLPDVVVYESN